MIIFQAILAFHLNLIPLLLLLQQGLKPLLLNFPLLTIKDLLNLFEELAKVMEGVVKLVMEGAKEPQL